MRATETMLSHPVDKNAVATQMADMRNLFMKSIVARRDLAAGVELRSEDLTTKKPDSGIPARQRAQVLGRRLARPVKAGDFLQEDDLEVLP